jgi:hypothetical protein
LGSIDDPRVHSILIQALEKSPSRGFRFIAAHWLTEHGCVQARKQLTRALADTDWLVAREAAQAMGNFGDASAIGPLRALAGEWLAEGRPLESRLTPNQQDCMWRLDRSTELNAWKAQIALDALAKIELRMRESSDEMP